MNPEEIDMVSRDLDELWREYEWDSPQTGIRVYRIKNPVRLMYRPNGSTHTIIDSNFVAHTLPAPGEYGCVVRWRSSSSSIRAF